jgi:hypothetical protein
MHSPQKHTQTHTHPQKQPLCNNLTTALARSSSPWWLLLRSQVLLLLVALLRFEMFLLLFWLSAL